ncbi:hypothetical protein [Aquabacterium sp.]|uniref:hypothetical protein n=1 Tax=Aquabacterium sp. TaxID=1872578 RepID=UPI00378420DB
MQFGRIPGTWSVVSFASAAAALPLGTATAPDEDPDLPLGQPLSRTALHRSAQMNLQFDPARSHQLWTDAPRIWFAQCCRIVADGRVVKPGRFSRQWAYRDAFTLDNGMFLDVEVQDHPYYPFTNPGRWERRVDAPPISEVAVMSDAPQIGSTEPIMFHPQRHPQGFKTVTFTLHTFALSRGAPEEHRWLEGAVWEWKTTAAEFDSGQPGQVRLVVLNVPTATLDLRAAFARYLAVTGQRP